MWEMKKNYPREEEDMNCPICNRKKDTTEHVLECKTAETVYRTKNNTTNQWTEVVKVYRQNKELNKKTKRGVRIQNKKSTVRTGVTYKRQERREQKEN